MTVEELIEKLTELPKDLEIQIKCGVTLEIIQDVKVTKYGSTEYAHLIRDNQENRRRWI